MKQKYVVVYEETPNNYCAYLPDLPGCVSTGKTREEIRESVREAVVFHIEGMLKHGDPLPESPMSLNQAVAYHNEPLTEAEQETLAGYGPDSPLLSTTFGMVEVEVQAYAGAKGAA